MTKDKFGCAGMNGNVSQAVVKGGVGEKLMVVKREGSGIIMHFKHMKYIYPILLSAKVRSLIRKLNEKVDGLIQKKAGRPRDKAIK